MTRRRVLFIYGLLALELVAASLVSPVFASQRNARNVLLQLVVLGVAALGQSFVLITGGFDLSVGSVIALALALSTMYMPGDFIGLAAMVLAIFGISVLVGVINAVLVARGKLNPFIVTLAMMSVIQGVVLILRPRPSGLVPPMLQRFSLGRIGFIPYPVLLLLLLVLVGQWLFSRTRFGLHLFAVGGNEENALLSGVRVSLVKSGAYMACSLLAGIGGLLLAGILGSADPTVGTEYALESVTAAVIGGVSLSGGQGNLFGVLAGVMFIAVLRNAMNLVGVPNHYQLIAIGAIFGVSMALTSIRASSRDSTGLPWLTRKRGVETRDEI